LNDKRAVIFCLTVLLLSGTVIGYAAVPQSTVRTTGAGITTYVGHFGNFTESVETNAYFLGAVNKTDVLAFPYSAASYIIEIDDTTIRAINGTTGIEAFSGLDPDVIINYALGNCTGEVKLRSGIYTTDAVLNIGAGDVLSGEGFSTIIKYNNGGNAITFTGDNSKLHNLKVEIQAGAGIVSTRPNCVLVNNRENIEIMGVWTHGDSSVADDGSSLRQVGILLNHTSNSRVINCISDQNGRYGVYVTDNSFLNSITGNTLSNNSRYGFYLSVDSSYNTATGNTANNNVLAGGRLSGGASWAVHHNTITGNTFNENGEHGFVVNSNSHHNIISSNICSNNIRIGIYCDSDYNTITGNNLFNNTEEGIKIEGGIGNTVSSNTANGNGEYGITLTTSAGSNSVTGNTCTENTLDGILLLSNANNNTIAGNNCYENGASGIYVYVGHFNSVTGNTCNDNIGVGISLKSSNKNIITGNMIRDNADGINLDASDDNTITGNACYDSPSYGIDIANDTSDDNLILGNVLIDNNVALRDQGTSTVKRNNQGLTQMGDIQNNAGNIEMYNGTAWVIIGP